MSSTAATVRAELVTAIEGIAHSSLGFDDADTAVADYPIEFVPAEQISAYLMRRVSNMLRARRWSVHVTESEQMISSGGNGGNIIVDRVYQCRIAGYYGLGVDGEGVKTLIAHASKVREAIYAKSSRLNLTVDRFLGVSELQLSPLGQTDCSEPVLRGVLIFQYAKGKPDF